MKRLVLFLFIAIMANISFAQTLEVDWGNFFETNEEHYIHKVIGSDSDGFYILKSDNIYGCKNAQSWIEYYSRSMYNLELSSELMMPSVNGEPTEFEDIFFLDGKLILFTSHVDSHRKMRVAYMQYVNKDGTLKNVPKEIGQLPPQNGKFGFNFKLSADGKKIFFYYHKYFEKYNGEEITCKVINSNLAEEFSENLTLPFKEKTLELTQFELGSSGNIYMEAQVLQEAKKGRTTSDAYDFAIISYNKTRKDFFVYDVNLKKNIPSSCIFGLTKEENIVFGGFYSAKTARDGQFMGSYYQVLNPATQKIVSPTTESKDVYYIIDRTKFAEFSDKRLGPAQYNYNYTLKGVFCLDNGGFVFISEHTYTDTTEIKDPATKQSTYVKYYHHNDILAFGVDPKGKMSYMQRIPKNQYGIDDNAYFSSFTALRVKDKIKIFYNDHPSNLKQTDLTKIKEFKNNVKTSPKGLSVITTIFNDGSLGKAEMFNDADLKTIFIPATITPLGDAFLVGGLKGKYMKFGSYFLQ